jgi:hypothetical protein
MSELSGILLTAPDHWLDHKMRPLIQKWEDPPKAIQILEVLDHCIHGALAAGAVVALLQVCYREALDREGTTHEAVLPLATWRPEEDRG